MARVVLIALFAKAYTVLLLFLFFQRGEIRADYEAFLYLEKEEKREDRLAEVKGRFIHRMTPYDAQYYLDISDRGYRRFEKGTQFASEGNYAFFPLLPLLLRLNPFSTTESKVASLLVLNGLLSATAAVAMWYLAKEIGVPPWLSVGFLLAFPTAVFQSVLYTESLFLFLAVFGALCALRGYSGRGALLGYLGGLCRPQGALLCLFPFGHVLERGRRSFRDMKSVGKAYFPFAAPLAGVATFAVILWRSVDSPLGFVKIQSNWGRQFLSTSLFSQVFHYLGPPMDVVSFVLGVGLLPFLWRYLPRSLALFGTGLVVLPILTGSILSFSRFLSVSFPHFLCLAKILENWKLASVVLLAAFVIAQALVCNGLINWHFVG